MQVAFELDLCVEMMNRTVAGLEGVDTGMHLCHAHFDREHGSEGSYELIMDALGKINIGTVSLEYASPVSHGVGSLRHFPQNARLGLGCIDHCAREVETPEQVVARVEAAMEYVPMERISLHPDCGFAPSIQNPMDLDEAYQKLTGSSCKPCQLTAYFTPSQLLLFGSERAQWNVVYVCPSIPFSLCSYVHRINDSAI